MINITKASIKSISNLNVSSLNKLGYGLGEATWIKNLAWELNKPANFNMIFENNSQSIKFDLFEKKITNIYCEEDGHSGGTEMYTKTILKSILLNNYSNWTCYNVHLSYNIVFNCFYFPGYQHFAKELIMYNFSNPEEYKILLEFNKKNDKSNPKEIAKLLRVLAKHNLIN